MRYAFGMRNPRKSLLACGIVFGISFLVAVGFVADKLISRPQRIEFQRKKADLMYVRDAVMRYEFRSGSLPISLEHLVPKYLRKTQVKSDGKPIYKYDRRQRLIAMAEGVRIRGLYVRHYPALSLALPEQEKPEEIRPSPHTAQIQSGATLVIQPNPPKPLPPNTTPDPTSTPAVPSLPPPFVIPKGPALSAPPNGTIVIEAEHWSEMNWGWEVHLDPKAAGGAYIICKEGMTTGSAQCHWATYDFYNIREKQEKSLLKYHFHLPKAGWYRLSARLWATCSHCSNSLNIGIDRGGLKPGTVDKDYYGDFVGSRVPFRWNWSMVRSRSIYLTAGDHYIHVFPHEDGLHVDQFLLQPVSNSRYWSRSKAFQANKKTNHGTAFEKKDGPPVHLSFDMKSMVITKKMPLQAKLTIRRLRPSIQSATFKIILRAAGKHMADLDIGKFKVDLSHLPELCFIPLDFSGIDYDTLPRREYLLTAELVAGEKKLASTHIPVMHPFAWEISTNYKYYPNSLPGPLDGHKEPEPGNKDPWSLFADRSWTPLGVMDFGVHTVGNSLHAPEYRTIYVRTVIDVPKTAQYFLKAQSDDQMLLWIDGQLAGRIDTKRSVIRNVGRIRIQLKKGRHTVRMRVNQGPQTRKLQGGYWQSSLRFRTSDDLLSNVTGIEK